MLAMLLGDALHTISLPDARAPIRLVCNALRGQLGALSPHWSVQWESEWVVRVRGATLVARAHPPHACSGYKDQTVALNCGVMLRDALRDPAIAQHILESELLDDFFQYVQVCSFRPALMSRGLMVCTARPAHLQRSPLLFAVRTVRAVHPPQLSAVHAVHAPQHSAVCAVHRTVRGRLVGEPAWWEAASCMTQTRTPIPLDASGCQTRRPPLP
jgi:hypothetical protein